jgi:hypothetical protein
MLPALPGWHIRPGEVVTLTATLSDPGLLDTHSVTITWEADDVEVLDLGAGVLEFSASRAFPAPETYPVTVSVTDKDGGSSTQGFAVTVAYRLFLPLLLR